MANRHHLRSIVLQTLFEWDFRLMTQSNEAISALKVNLLEFAPENAEDDFPVMLVEGVVKKQKVIDDIIEKAAPGWPIPRIAVVDRNILRLGLFELLFADRNQVPPKVAINEAIELAKSFGGENSGRFVNGVLGAVYKEIGEPGKERTGKKTPPADVPYEDMPIDQKAGAVVYAFDENGGMQLAMVHDIFGYWTLSKGGVEVNETPAEAAVREVKEEIGLAITVEKELGQNEYIANHPERGKVRKYVYYFLAKSDFVPITLMQDSGGLDDAKWFPIEEVVNLDMYEDITQMIAKAIEVVSTKQISDDTIAAAQIDNSTTTPEIAANHFATPRSSTLANIDPAPQSPPSSALPPQAPVPNFVTVQKPNSPDSKKSETALVQQLEQKDEDDEDLSFARAFLTEE